MDVISQKIKSSALATLTDFKLHLSKDQIARRIQEIAGQIDQDYQGKEIVLVMVMKGALCLTADLMRALTIPCSLEYVQASSYGQNGASSGDLKLRGIEDLSLKDRHAIIVDDIFDTGNTMTKIKEQLLLQQPASLKTWYYS
jgi:hypoxanthine phosphoribosyltransferase